MSKIKELLAAVDDIDDLTPADNMEVAHIAWLIEKETVINELTMLMNDTSSDAYKGALRHAIEFIEKGEV